MTARREVAELVVPCEVMFRYCVVVAGRRLVSMCTTRLITLKLHIFPVLCVCLFCTVATMIMYPAVHTGCPRRNVRDFGRVFLILNYTDITQNTYTQSWTVTEIMAIEKCGLLGGPRTVRRPWRHARPVRMPGNETPLANIVMQRPWRDNASAEACVKYLET